MQETVFCDTCKHVINVAELKEVEVLTAISTTPNGNHPKEFRYAIFRCPNCSSKSASSIRATS